MNTLQDNARFIKIIYYNGIIKNLSKYHLKNIKVDQNSVFIESSNNSGLSLNNDEFFMMKKPDTLYPSTEALYEDITAIVNNGIPTFTLYPKINNFQLTPVTIGKFDVDYSLNKEGKLRSIFLASGSATPSMEQLVLGLDSVNSPALYNMSLDVLGENLSGSIQIDTLLSPGVNLDVYIFTTTLNELDYPPESIQTETTTII